MKKLEKLNLQEEEILDQAAFMAYTGYVSGASGTEDPSGSSGESSGPILDDECSSDKDCNQGESGTHMCVDNGYVWPFNRKICKVMSITESPCRGKELYSDCAFIWNDKLYRGECVWAVGAQAAHCSDKPWIYKPQK